MSTLPNAKWLIHQVIFNKVTGSDDYDKPIYGDDIAVDQVRFDSNHEYTGTGNNRVISRRGTIFIYPKYSDFDIDDSFLRAKVFFYGSEFIVTEIQPNYDVTTNEIYSYEVGVI